MSLGCETKATGHCKELARAGAGAAVLRTLRTPRAFFASLPNVTPDLARSLHPSRLYLVHSRLDKPPRRRLVKRPGKFEQDLSPFSSSARIPLSFRVARLDVNPKPREPSSYVPGPSKRGSRVLYARDQRTTSSNPVYFIRLAVFSIVSFASSTSIHVSTVSASVHPSLVRRVCGGNHPFSTPLSSPSSLLGAPSRSPSGLAPFQHHD